MLGKSVQVKHFRWHQFFPEDQGCRLSRCDLVSIVVAAVVACAIARVLDNRTEMLDKYSLVLVLPYIFLTLLYKDRGWSLFTLILTCASQASKLSIWYISSYIRFLFVWNYLTMTNNRLSTPSLASISKHTLSHAEFTLLPAEGLVFPLQKLYSEMLCS